jgi:hypothetical protein
MQDCLHAISEIYDYMTVGQYDTNIPSDTIKYLMSDDTKLLKVQNFDKVITSDVS